METDTLSSAPEGAAAGTTEHVVTAVTVRYFAAAHAAAGVEQETVSVPAPATVDAVLAAAVVAHGDELARVLQRCSYLRNTFAVHGLETVLEDGDTLDVLPPFAGG